MNDLKAVFDVVVLFLQVTDDGTPALTRYRRIIVTVLAKTSSGHDEL